MACGKPSNGRSLGLLSAMARVALVAPLPPLRGGIAHHSDSLARALAGEGQDVWALSYHRQYPRLFFPGRTERDDGQAAAAVPASHTLTSLSPARWLLGLRDLARFHPEVVVIAWWNAGLLGPVAAVLAAARAVGWRSVVMAHNVSTHEGGRAALDEVAWSVLARGADAIVVHGEKAAATLRDRHPRLSVTAHPHPRYDRFAAAAVSREEARRRLSLRDDDEVCLSLGNVRPYKGVDVAVRAVAALAHERPRLKLVVAGEIYDNARDEMLAALATAPPGGVRVVDRYLDDDEVALYASAADVLLASHRHASQSGVVQVAKALGLPVIASRVGGLPELVDVDAGDVLVPAGDEGALAAAIDAFFTAPAPARVLSVDEGAGWASLARAILAAAALS